MALQITSDTIVKILVRRGQEEDRQKTLLSEGELGLSVTTGRLFVGDGVNLGGNPVSNIFHGFVANRNDSSIVSIAQHGDQIFQNTNATLYGFDSLTNTWKNIHPHFGVSLEQNNTDWDLRREAFSPAFGFDPYQPEPGSNTLNTVLGPSKTKYSITGEPGVVDFNSKYISLCAGPLSGSMYFGNIHSRTVRNNFNAGVNVDTSLYINGTDTNPNQIQITAKNSNGNSELRSVSGVFDIAGESVFNINSRRWNVININEGSNFNFVPAVTGGYSTPNFYVRGISRFNNDAFFDSNVTVQKNFLVNNDLTVTGNLSVFGEVGYYETNVVTTSALSVVAFNENLVSLDVRHFTNSPNSIVSRYNSRKSLSASQAVLILKDGPYVGINAPPLQTYTGFNPAGLPGTVFSCNGSVFFGQDQGLYGGVQNTHANGTEFFIVSTGRQGITLDAIPVVPGSPFSFNNAGPLRSRVSSVTVSTVGNILNSDAGNLTVTLTGNARITGISGHHMNDDFVRITTERSSWSKAALDLQGDDTDPRGIKLFSDTSANNFNSMVYNRDGAIIFYSDGPVEETSAATGLTIAPWSNGLTPRGIRIDRTGKLGICKDAELYSYTLDVNGTAGISSTLDVTGNTTIGGSLNVNGANGIRATGDIIAFFTSDRRLKKKITTIESALEKLEKISGVNFEWDEDVQTVHTGADVGVIAQEVEEVLPEAVTRRENGYMAVRYEKIIPLLIEAVKELKTLIK